MPYQEELTLDPEAAYVHFTANNTIFGTEWPEEPAVGNIPLVSDASSNIFSKPIDIDRYGLVYAGAQKNLGIAGLTLVIIRDDLLGLNSATLPAMLDYNTHARAKSAHNTPPVFAVYVLGLVIRWMLDQGGLAEMGRRNSEKARRIYDVIDSSELYGATLSPSTGLR